MSCRQPGTVGFTARLFQETQSLPESCSCEPQSRACVHEGEPRDQWLNVCSQRASDTSLQSWRKRVFFFFFFLGCHAQSPWCRRCGDASPERLALCGGISYSICLAAVRRSLESPWVCPSKHTKRKPSILSVNKPQTRTLPSWLCYAIVSQRSLL